MTNSEIDELLAGLLAIDEDVPAAPVDDLPAKLSPSDVALIEELNAIARGEFTTTSAPKIVAVAGQIETDFPYTSKGCGVVLSEEGQCAIPPPTPTLTSPHPAHQHHRDGQQNDQNTTTAIATVNPSPASQPKDTVHSVTRRSASSGSGAGKRPTTRKPRKAAARVAEVATKKTWEGTKSLGMTDRLSNAEKFALGVSHAASVGGVAVSLNLGIGREGMLTDTEDPRRRMMQHLNKHLGAAGFGYLPYALVFEIAPTKEGGRLHLHGAIVTTGLSNDDMDRLRLALQRAGSFAEGSLGGQRQVDLSPIPYAAGWADYCLKDTSRVELELGIDDPYMINHPMKRLARQHFEQLQDEVHDLHQAHKTMRLQRRRDLKQQTSHCHVFTLRSRRGMISVSGERDEKHLGGVVLRTPHRLQTSTPSMTRSSKWSATMTTPRKRGTA